MSLGCNICRTPLTILIFPGRILCRRCSISTKTILAGFRVVRKALFRISSWPDAQGLLHQQLKQSETHRKEVGPPTAHASQRLGPPYSCQPTRSLPVLIRSNCSMAVHMKFAFIAQGMFAFTMFAYLHLCLQSGMRTLCVHG